MLSEKKYICTSTLFAVTCITTLVAGLWPFFWPENEVKWMPDKNGISFYGNGIAYTPDAFNGFTQNLSQNNNSVTVELWLQSKVKPIRHLNHFHSARWHYAPILSLYNNEQSKEFEIAQWKSDLVISSRSNKYKRITLQNTLFFDKTQFITITSGTEGTTIHLDGKPINFYEKYSLLAENKMTSGQLLIGNTPNIKEPWIGNIFGLAVYNRSLTSEEVQQNYHAWLEHCIPPPTKKIVPLVLYLFNEQNGTMAHNHSGNQYNLLIPDTLQELRQKNIVQSWKEFGLKRFSDKDFFVNVLGFIPFGFFLSACLYNSKKFTWYRIYLIIILLGAGFSLTIELLQIYIPTRGPSFIDLTNNVFGAVIGVIILKSILSYFFSRKSPERTNEC